MTSEPATAKPTAGGMIEQIAMIWSEALGLPVNRESDYFELGGDSLTALKIAHAVADRYPACTGLEDRALQGLFECATLGEYAQHLHEIVLGCDRLTSRAD